MNRLALRLPVFHANMETLLFSILLIVEIFNGFGIKPLYLAVGLMLMGFAAMSFFAIKKYGLETRMFRLAFLWTAYHILWAGMEMSGRTFYTCFQHIALFLVFIMVFEGEKLGLQKGDIKMVYRIIHYFVLFFLLFIVFMRPSLSATFESYVYIGLISIAFVIAEWKGWRYLRVIVLCLTWAVIAYMIKARAQAVGFVIFIIVSISMPALIQKHNVFVQKLFWVYYTLLNIFPMIYTAVSQSRFRPVLENFSYQFTRARFFSGRDELWLAVYDKMTNPFNYLFGLGFQATNRMTEEMDMSLHSLYVTIISEGGVLLVILLGLLLYEIWKMLVKNGSYQSSIMLSFLVVFLYKQSFDISLIENNLWVAFGVWTTLALACADAKECATEK